MLLEGNTSGEELEGTSAASGALAGVDDGRGGDTGDGLGTGTLADGETVGGDAAGDGDGEAIGLTLRGGDFTGECAWEGAGEGASVECA